MPSRPTSAITPSTQPLTNKNAPQQPPFHLFIVFSLHLGVFLPIGFPPTIAGHWVIARVKGEVVDMQQKQTAVFSPHF
jgi:hypothetical protein